MIGCINMFKMDIHQKFLYLFQTIPLYPLTGGNKLFHNLIWNSKHSRLRLALLYLPCDRGGLILSNLQGYSWTAQLWTVSFWSERKSPLVQIRIEEATTSKIPLNLYLYSAKLSRLKKYTSNLCKFYVYLKVNIKLKKHQTFSFNVFFFIFIKTMKQHI